jgi:cytoskeletal protein RodZ
MDQLGEELKRAREAAGLSLRDMEARTKISVTALEALERNDFSRLPGGIFGRSFVRAYALEVGADPDTTVSRFVALLEQSEREAAERRAARRPEITQDDRQFLERQKRALILLRIVLVLAVIGVITLVSWRVRVMLARPETPVAEATPTPAIVPPAPADPVPTPPAPVAGDPVSSVMVLEFDLTGDCWVQISIDGANPVARLYRAGEHQRVEATREVLLDVGNAGALRLEIDGKPARSLGGDGARVRTRITRENAATFLQDGAGD